MAGTRRSGKLYRLFTVEGAFSSASGRVGPAECKAMIVGLAVAIFVALFGWGSNYFGWSDPDGKVQLALVTAFILGVIGGFKSRG